MTVEIYHNASANLCYVIVGLVGCHCVVGTKEYIRLFFGRAEASVNPGIRGKIALCYVQGTLVIVVLRAVKKIGFRNAFIVAYVDGKSVTVAKARAKEKEKPNTQELYEVCMVPSGGELDPGVAAGIRQQASGKDIAKSVRADGSVAYVVGPFADKAKAEDLAMFIKAMGVKDVSCNLIRK